MNDLTWQWEDGSISQEICDSWVERYDDRLIQGLVRDKVGCSDKRISDISFVDDHDVMSIIKDKIYTANRSSFGVDVNGFFECQYTKYTGDNLGHYDWHMDIMNGSGLAIDRKITCIIMLSDRSDYEGGELYVGRNAVDLGKGAVIAFPSFVAHKVSPVTSGVRRVMVGLAEGSHWR
jgi:PKHD-type hydroxylase